MYVTVFVPKWCSLTHTLMTSLFPRSYPLAHALITSSISPMVATYTCTHNQLLCPSGGHLHRYS